MTTTLPPLTTFIIMPRVGIKGQTYANTGSYSAPVWNRYKAARDLTVAVSANEVAVKNKGSIFVKYLSGLKDTPLDFEADWEPNEPVFDMLQQCFWTQDPIDFLILDGGIKKVGAQGLRGGFIVTKFERSEPVEDVMSVSVSLRLSAEWPQEPEWVKMSAGGVPVVVGAFGDDPDNDP